MDLGCSSGCISHTYRILLTEYETQPEDLVFVDGIVVEHADIEEPFAEVIGTDEIDAWW